MDDELASAASKRKRVGDSAGSFTATATAETASDLNDQRLTKRTKRFQDADVLAARALRGGPVFDDVYLGTEDDVELELIEKFREFRRKHSRTGGAYSDLNLQELLNPPDRLEAIVMHSSRRHRANNLQLEALATSAIKMIEVEHKFVRLLNHVAMILQGEDPQWQEVSWSTDEQKLIGDCQYDVQQLADFYTIFVEKLQEIRKKVTAMYDKKRELIRNLQLRVSEEAVADIDE